MIYIFPKWSSHKALFCKGKTINYQIKVKLIRLIKHNIFFIFKEACISSIVQYENPQTFYRSITFKMF